MKLPLGKGDAFLLGLLKIEKFAQRVRAAARSAGCCPWVCFRPRSEGDLVTAMTTRGTVLVFESMIVLRLSLTKRCWAPTTIENTIEVP